MGGFNSLQKYADERQLTIGWLNTFAPHIANHIHRHCRVRVIAVTDKAIDHYRRRYDSQRPFKWRDN